jgi:hypothetical protein
LHLAGYRFVVLPDAFVIHIEHGKPKWRATANETRVWVNWYSFAHANEYKYRADHKPKKFFTEGWPLLDKPPFTPPALSDGTTAVVAAGGAEGGGGGDGAVECARCGHCKGVEGGVGAAGGASSAEIVALTASVRESTSAALQAAQASADCASSKGTAGEVAGVKSEKAALEQSLKAMQVRVRMLIGCCTRGDRCR